MIPVETKRASDSFLASAWDKATATGEQHDPCYVCGRPVKVGPKTMWLRIVSGGGMAAEPGEEVDERGDMGCFPVGPECLRSQPSLKCATVLLPELSEAQAGGA
jgi:hypothetical protein